MSDPNPIIAMSGVTIGTMRDPTVTVVAGVDWTVNSGDFWVVAGLHRSGKSDLLMTAAGLMAPQSGSYRLFGQPMPIFEGENLPIRLRLGFVFDGGQLFNNLTVAENVGLPLRYHEYLSPGEQTARVQQLLEMTELTPLAGNTPGNLGRNWCQRVGLARALALQPEILLLDSPLTGLDVRDASWWLHFLGQLSAGHEYMPEKRATTLVVSADDLRPWRERAKQFAVLQEKRFEVLGDRAHLAAEADALVKELLAEETTTG